MNKMKKDYGFQPVPVSDKPVSQFTEEEAKMMYEWYIDDLPKRAEHLFDFINLFTKIELDYSFETFKEVIKWLPQALGTEKKSWFELQNEKKHVSKEERKLLKKWRFNKDSELIITSVGGYFGMVLEKNVPDTKWIIENDINSPYYNFSVIKIENKKKISPVEIIDDLATMIVEKKEIDIDKFIKWLID